MSNVVTGEWVGSPMMQILQEYAEKIGTSIFVVDNQGELYSPKAQKRLTICFYGSPTLGPFSGGAETYIEKVLYRFSLEDSQKNALTPSLVGLKISDPNGVTVAEVVENTLYILINILEDEGHSEKILDRIMADYMKLPTSLEERRSIISNRIEKLRSSSEVNFKKLFCQTLHKDIEINKQFDVLKRMSKDGDLIIANGEIRVPLGRVIMTRKYSDHSETKLDIGKIFFVLGRIQTKEPTVQIFCLTKDPDDSNDYIGDMGYVCLGNISYGVNKLIRDSEYALAAEAVKLFIEEEN